ncbi:DUF6691 family protein [Pragia fontium]|uniref:YeeE/YedE family protein n=1 Tax=Pragia fontium DSM 5563 = ATCC 49100 TaxID=1122977 RepID=A0AAJ5BIS5_9GAMM|nr:DUF6691 family protein [Pragia fontium]SFD50076.1 hypothetical protein SAMN02745723_1243 [Pragia fontium DSM 5563 = ATCC 49100]VEJ56714.1 Predicted transporter component [Pragia fontium]
MKLVFAFLSGLIFGLGMLISGMVNPLKVLSFLDITRSWDPSLALVMGGAIAVGLLAFSWMKRRQRSLLGESVQLPLARHIDKRLIGGSALFGIGWGIAGICPGPGLVLLGAGVAKGFIFVAAMVAGMLIFNLIERARH